MRDLWHDVRLALRSLGRAPGFTAVAVLSLGTGIGAVTTIYNWTDRFLIHPLPAVPDAGRLVQVHTRSPGGGTWSVSYPTWREWAARNRVFEGLAAAAPRSVGVRAGEAVERAWALLASGNYFEVLGVRALHGRALRPGDEAEAAPVVVLGHDYWTRRFAADPGVVGRPVVVNGQGFEVVGVLPPGFGGSYVGLTLDLYVPVTTAPLLFGDRRLEQRGSMFLEGLGRLRPGVSPSAAGEDLRRVGRELEAVFPGAFNEGVVRSIREQGPPATMRPVFVALLGVTGLVLLIACANVANLLLSRAVARRREIGVRLALGAGRGRLVRQLLVESGLLALGGAALGLLLTHAGRNALMLLVPPTPFPIAMEFPVNGRVLAVALGLGAATVVLFGLWPALRASRPDLVTALKGLPAQGTGRSPARSALVAGQVALAMVSLACAGLFLRAIERSHALDPGFREPEGVLLLDTDLRAAGLTDSTGPVVLDRILERIRAVPGVERAAASSFVPLGWSCCNSSTVRIDGYEPQPDEHMSITKALVTADYFETMRIDLVAGRSFTARDREGAPVAIVNEAFARRFWPGVPAVGRQFEQEGRRFTVVGVARDGRYRQLTDPPFALVYRVLGQGYEPDLTLHVRVASGPPGALAETVRRAVRAEHADLLLAAARTMPESMLQATIGQRIGSRTLAVFGGLALLLAAVGIYGVMAYSVSQRTREIGVRMALGADRAGVARLVLRQGARITAAGLLAGGALAFGAGRLLQGLLLGLSPADPLTFAGVAGLLALVALLACLLPARRAAAVDPVRAFRAD